MVTAFEDSQALLRTPRPWTLSVLDPGLARCGPPEPPGSHWAAFDRTLGVLLRGAHLAT
jgi:hypothetical protein